MRNWLKCFWLLLESVALSIKVSFLRLVLPPANTFFESNDEPPRVAPLPPRLAAFAGPSISLSGAVLVPGRWILSARAAPRTRKFCLGDGIPLDNGMAAGADFGMGARDFLEISGSSSDESESLLMRLFAWFHIRDTHLYGGFY
jgi:hypothetical protein